MEELGGDLEGTLIVQKATVPALQEAAIDQARASWVAKDKASRSSAPDRAVANPDLPHAWSLGGITSVALLSAPLCPSSVLHWGIVER